MATRLNRLQIAYLHVVDGLAFGFHELGAPVTLKEARGVFEGPLIGNCGYTRETAEGALRRRDGDLISFGRPYISNPDLVERLSNHWPLNPPADMKIWYSFDKVGYTDCLRYRISETKE